VADRWRDRRVFLLGDAAHLTPPFIGQGMGAGLRDAANLAWKLAGVLDGTLQEDVLDSYQTERQPHVTTMIRLAILMGRAMTSGGRIGDRARRMIAPRLHLVPGLRRMLTEGRTPPLHDSALVHRRRRRSELAGTLCPNPLIDGSRRLDDLTGGAFVLITGTTLTDHQRRALEQRRVSVITAAPGERLHRWLGRDRAALVRPDKTVMWAGRDLEHVCRIAPPSPCAHDSEATRPVRIIRS
jgi:3-(3-hydroxy-phenyl)propionate hydroxylase